MPFIQVKLVGEVLTPAQKNEMIARLTKAMSAVRSESARTATWVIIEDVLSGDLWHSGCRVAHQGRCVADCQVGDG